MRHYLNVFTCIACVWLLGLACAAWALGYEGDLRGQRDRAQEAGRQAFESLMKARRAQAELEAGMPPLRQFLKEWDPHLRRGSDEREVGIALRAGLEVLAQQRLSLVTDQATTPEAGKVLLGGRSLRVQRVSLRASGESLAALVTWLGEAELSFPYARVEAWELASAGGSNCSLRAMLTQPLTGETSERKGVVQR